MKARLLLAAFLASVVVASSQPACTSFYDCIYVTLEGYRICADLEPVVTITRAGEAIEVVDEFGQPPTGCTCMHPDTVSLWEQNPLDPTLDPLFDQMQDDAVVACKELAIELGADPIPCESALIDKSTANKDAGTTSKCPFAANDIDDNCPPVGEDEVGFTTDGTDTTGDDGGVVVIPDLPKQP
ncbi:hypothetical protein ACNOYE_25520 [Nannocystaceae bacterium ST9]